MDLQKLYPWNWFKHEESNSGSAIPVRHGELLPSTARDRADHPLLQLQRQMDRVFDEMLTGAGFPTLNAAKDPFWQRPMFQATVNVSSDAKNYHISVEAPGLTEQDISLELSEGVLTISGEKREENETKDRHYYRVERRYGNFRRMLSLPDDGDVDAIRASMKNGVLEITLPRKHVTERNVKRIPIGT